MHHEWELWWYNDRIQLPGYNRTHLTSTCSYCISTVHWWMVISVVLHTLSGTIPHSRLIPPYRRRIQASNMSRITRSPYRGKNSPLHTRKLNNWFPTECSHFIYPSHPTLSHQNLSRTTWRCESIMRVVGDAKLPGARWVHGDNHIPFSYFTRGCQKTGMPKNGEAKFPMTPG